MNVSLLFVLISSTGFETDFFFRGQNEMERLWFATFKKLFKTKMNRLAILNRGESKSHLGL